MSSPSPQQQQQQQHINLFKDSIDLTQATSILSTGFKAYLHNISTKDNSNNTTTNYNDLTKEQLILIYKKECKEYKEVIASLHKQVNVKEMLVQYSNTVNDLINRMKCEYDIKVKNANEQNEMISKLKYDDFKKDNVDYYEVSKDYYNKLINNSEKIVSCLIKDKILNDDIKRFGIMRNTYKSIGDVFDNVSQEIYDKIVDIDKSNKAVEMDAKVKKEETEKIWTFYENNSMGEVPC